MSDSVVILKFTPINGGASGVVRGRKPSGIPYHRPTQMLVDNAIKGLKDRSGSSLVAIKKYIGNTYKTDAERLVPFIKCYLKAAVANGKLMQPTGNGASGSFKMARKSPKPKPASTEKKSEKPTTATTSKKKPTTAAKKPAAVGKKPKKSVASKKTTPADKKKTEKAKAKDIKKSGAVKAKPTSKATTKTGAAKPKAPKPKTTAAKPKKAAASAPKKAAAKKVPTKK